MNQFLFISDLDNTLVGDDQALKKLNQILQKQRKENGTKIVYATGRSLFLYQKLATEKNLIPPDALIAAVGTELYLSPKTAEIDQDWENLLSQNWQREKILSITQQFPALIPQPPSEQGQFKVSFYLSSAEAQTVMVSLKQRLEDISLKFKMIYSGSQDLDIIPQSADKGLAVKFLQKKWEMSDGKTVVCGDSGNDIALFETGNPYGIVVGNAKSELREWYQKNKADYLYFAQHPYATGIQEGLAYFHFIHESLL